MSDIGDILFRKHFGTTYEEWARTPSLDNERLRLLKQLGSAYPPFLLGYAADGAVFVSEEERTHFHVLGEPGQGKSKLLELFARHDIDRLAASPTAPGFCLIDSSDYGGTYRKVLRYCRQIGFDKVCVINPHDFLDKDIRKVPTINPFGSLRDVDGTHRYGLLKSLAAQKIKDCFRILWDDDQTVITNISRYLGAVSDVLHNGNYTLADAVYFTDQRGNDFYRARREHILADYSLFDSSRITLESVFASNPSIFDRRFGSTVGRLDPLRRHPLDLIFSSTASPIDFRKLIADGWVFLCNLDPQNLWEVSHQKLLGTFIISEIINAIYSLNRRGRNIPFYLAIDEVGRYATETLTEVIHYKRTSNIRLIMAHQQFSQLTDRQVMAGVKSAPNKVLFHAGRDDMEEMISQMYHGTVQHEAYGALSALQKQVAVIKLHKSAPRVTRLVDVPDVPADSAADRVFLLKLYERPWYRTQEDINQEIHARFRRPYSRTGGPSEANRNRSAGSGQRPGDHGAPAGDADAQEPKSTTYFD
jgi:hypothetical protein